MCVSVRPCSGGVAAAMEQMDVFTAASRGDVEKLQACLEARPRDGASVRGYDG